MRSRRNGPRRLRREPRPESPPTRTVRAAARCEPILAPQRIVTQPYAVEVDRTCRHGGDVDHATVQRVPFGNQVKWQIRIYYDCEQGCHISEVREERPTRILDKAGDEVPTRTP